jgi:hypothetical protein
VTALEEQTELQHHNYGRPVVWIASDRRDNGAENSAIFTSFDEAVRFLKFGIYGIDWTNWKPDPRLQYPYEDRDGSDCPELNPKFVVHFDGGIGTVAKTSVAHKFDWGAKYRMEQLGFASGPHAAAEAK